ncbi:hypothetical protein Tco_0232953 [Tanacetum coccineum]
MLHRTDFASWQQRIRLYCRGKENGMNILKSIDEGTFQMGTFWETLTEGNEGALHLGPERARVYTDLLPEEKDMYNADIWATNILLQGLPKDIYTLINHYTDAKDIWDNVKMLLEGSELTKEYRESQLYDDFEDFRQNKGETIHDYYGRFVKAVKLNRGQTRQIKCYNYNGIAHIARNCTQPKQPQNSKYFKDKMLLMQAQKNGVALDEDQLLFIAAVYDEASPSYDSDILFEVHDHDNYQDVVCEHHEVHEMHDDVQQNCIVDSDAEYTSDSNMILYDQYVKDNVEFVIQIVNASLTAELARYKEQVELYERRAKFELNEIEQKIEEQLRIIITDRNIKEENLKKELYSVKMLLNSTINHNKSMVEEVTSLKTDFQQKENKYLEEFLDMKALKEKVEDRLFKQDQSVQTVHMLCKPKSFYDKNNRVAISYKNPFYLSKAKQVQPALYNGHEIVKPNHDRALVHDSEDTYEIAETTRKQMLEKMNDLECVKNKAKALSAKAKSANPNRALTVYHPNIHAKLVPEVLPTKKVFEQMEVEVDQHVIDKKCDEIERKNLLIENENLISDCLSKDVFYTITHFVITISRFFDMHDAFTTAQKRIAKLETGNSNLKNKIQNDDHDVMIKYFSKLEVEHLNLQLKYQHLKERFGNKKSVTSSDAPTVESVFVIGKL